MQCCVSDVVIFSCLFLFPPDTPIPGAEVAKQMASPVPLPVKSLPVTSSVLLSAILGNSVVKATGQLWEEVVKPGVFTSKLFTVQTHRPKLCQHEEATMILLKV